MTQLSSRIEKARKLDGKILEATARYKKSEAEIIEHLKELEKESLFRELGFTSLFEYATKRLKLSKDVAYNFITITRKSMIVPELQQAIENREITVSNAKRICSVVTPENKTHWLELAKKLPEHKLEKEIARVNPKTLTPEKVKYVTDSRMLLSIGISEELHGEIKRIQDLESQRQRKPVSIEEALKVMAGLYIKIHDPLVKAQRVKEREAKRTSRKTSGEMETNPTGASVERSLPEEKEVSEHPRLTEPEGQECRINICGTMEEFIQLGARREKELSLLAKSATAPRPLRKRINAELSRQMILRDRNRCSEPGCDNTRWLEWHHIVPVHEGGTNNLDNLKTLCWAHHKIHHAKSRHVN